MKKIENLKVQIFADGADKVGMLEMYAKPYIKGLTTNPTLMNKAGITDYRAFCKDILTHIKDKPLSFEVFSDDFEEMERQAIEIASWGDNVYVKIPITNTKQETCYALVKKLGQQKIKMNVTAIMTMTQVRNVVAALNPTVPSYVSVFAGRIADTGRDPVPMMAAAVEILKVAPARGARIGHGRRTGTKTEAIRIDALITRQCLQSGSRVEVDMHVDQPRGDIETFRVDDP